MNLTPREKDKLMIARSARRSNGWRDALCDLIRNRLSSLELERAALETQTPGDACFLSAYCPPWNLRYPGFLLFKITSNIFLAKLAGTECSK